MKLQLITLATVFSAIFATTSADAGSFNLGKAIQTVQKAQNTYNNVKQGGQPKYTTLPYNPNKGGNPGYVTPLPHPIHCEKPPVCHKPCPPVNQPPKKCYTMKLMNNAGAEVYYTLNKSDNYSTMPIDKVDWIKTLNPAPHTISYHNGHEVVEYQVAADGTYSFEWQGDTLQLLEIQG